MNKILLSSFICLSFISCTPTLYPIADEKTVTFRKELLGTWRSENSTFKVQQYLASEYRSKPFGESDSLQNPVTPEQKRLSAFAAKSYLIAYEEKGIQHVYEGRLTKIGKHLYAELRPYSIDSDQDPFTNHETGHSIARVELSTNRIGLIFLDGHKIKRLVVDGKLKIRYQHEKLFDHFIITATTSELRGFLEKYGSDERLFNKKDVVILTR